MAPRESAPRERAFRGVLAALILGLATWKGYQKMRRELAQAEA